MKKDPVLQQFWNTTGVKDSGRGQQPINLATQSSEYDKNEQEKQKGYVEQIKKMKVEIYNYNYNTNQFKQGEIQEIIRSKKSQIKLSTDQIIAHFDMDMFKVACELLNYPYYQDKPVALQQNDRISSVNYVARKFEVSCGQPVFIAKKQCPRLIILPSNLDQYQQISDKFTKILKEYDPELEEKELGQASLNLTNYISLNKITNIHWLCDSIRNKIFQLTKLTVSCGVGPNKMIAKLASKKNKPNGIFVVSQDKEGVQNFMAELPVRSLSGVGKKTEFILKGLDFKICQNIIEKADELYVAFQSTNQGNLFDKIFEQCLGQQKDGQRQQEKQSVSREKTFPPTSQEKELEKYLTEIEKILSQDLQHQELVGSRLTLTIKNEKFKLQNKSMQLTEHCNKQFIEQARQLLRHFSPFSPFEPIRMLRLKMGQLKYSNDDQDHEIQQSANLGTGTGTGTEQKQKIQTEFMPFHFCPYCGQKLDTTEDQSHFIDQLVKKVKKQ